MEIVEAKIDNGFPCSIDIMQVRVFTPFWKLSTVELVFMLMILRTEYTHQVASLELHKLVDALVLMHCIVIGDNTLPIDSGLLAKSTYDWMYIGGCGEPTSVEHCETAAANF